MRHLTLAAFAFILVGCGGDSDSSIDAAPSGIDAAAATLCPPTDDLECETANQVCVVTGPFGPTNMSECQPVPNGCESDRSCDCLEASLCPVGTIDCSEQAANTIFCDNGTQ